MSKNYLLMYSEQLATEIELLCQNIKASSLPLLIHLLVVLSQRKTTQFRVVFSFGKANARTEHGFSYSFVVNRSKWVAA